VVTFSAENLPAGKAKQASKLENLLSRREGSAPGALILQEAATTALACTSVLPSLESKIPDGKSAVWCAGFELAWKRVEADIGPFTISEPPICELPSPSEVSETDLLPESLYLNSGSIEDGIVARIMQDMKLKFPGIDPAIACPENPFGYLSYSFLSANVPFAISFNDHERAFVFTDSSGKRSDVSAFGIRPYDYGRFRSLRRQVQILYTNCRARGNTKPLEFIIDPCASSNPYRLLLARLVRRPQTLSEAISSVKSLMDRYNLQRQGMPVHFDDEDELLIPSMYWQLHHRFTAFEKVMSQARHMNAGNVEASEHIRFKLDRSGAALSTTTRIILTGPSPTYFFDRPYLILITKRARLRPFFAMWVDNAELMQKFNPGDTSP